MGLRGDMIQVTVDDNGPGIPAKKRDEVFKPFYRVEPSRNKNTGGVGLGMTIARDTILSHGGEIKLETSPMKGLRVLITLPIKNDIAQ
jgi:two-component system osmolarity sensor histidine kinase EnvZ